MRLVLKMPANPGVSRSASDSGLEDADESIRPLSVGRAVADRLADHLGRLRQAPVAPIGLPGRDGTAARRCINSGVEGGR
jgi:hypothetical protein